MQRIPPHTLKFDFLVRMRRTYVVVSLCLTPCSQGKDSIRYLQEHEVLPDVYEAIGQFAVGPCKSFVSA